MNQKQRNKKAEQLRIAAQIIETGAEWEIERVGMGWLDSGHIQNCQWGSPLDAINHGFPIRIKEQPAVIPVPEGWRELRDDEKDGRWIEGAMYLPVHGDWKHCLAYRDGRDDGAYAYSWNRIIVPVAKARVPLEPCDVPPGSVIDLKHGEEGWNLILVASKEGITILDKNNHPQDYTFEEMMEGHFESRIKRPTDTGWQPCSKEAP